MKCSANAALALILGLLIIDAWRRQGLLAHVALRVINVDELREQATSFSIASGALSAPTPASGRQCMMILYSFENRNHSPFVDDAREAAPAIC